MHAYKHSLVRLWLPHHQRDMSPALKIELECVNDPFADLRREFGRCNTTNQTLMLHPVLDQAVDGEHFQTVLRGESHQLFATCHRSVFVHHLADHTGRFQTRQATEINGRLGMSGPFQNSALLGPKWKYVPRTSQIFGA